MMLVVILNSIFKILYIVRWYQHLKDLYNFVNKYFQPTHAWVKDLFKVQEGPMNFNVTE